MSDDQTVTSVKCAIRDAEDHARRCADKAARESDPDQRATWGALALGWTRVAATCTFIQALWRVLSANGSSKIH